MTEATMVDVKGNKSSFTARFERITKGGSASGPSWLMPVRQAAFARFTEQGIPTTRHEEWRFTNLKRLGELVFDPNGAAASTITEDQLTPFDSSLPSGIRLVFVNGVLDAGLSSVPSLPTGVTVMPLAEAMETQASLVQSHLGQRDRFEDEPFLALNTALMQDGALVHVAKGVAMEAPIHLLFVSSANGSPTAAYPRVLIIAEESSQVTVIESHFGVGDGVYFSNAVTEIAAGENSNVDHYKITRETDDAIHIGAVQLHQLRSSNVASHAVTIGGGLVRHNINTILDGEGCECNLYGLYIVDGTQHVDNHLVVDHAKPHCDSREVFKGILDGHGKGIFSGRIIVREDAQKTDGKQTNMNLLLSDHAQVECKPQLEIFADDVRCTHGATIGQISEEALFYLRARALSAEAARSLLIYAFARDGLAHIRIEPLRDQLSKLILAKLPHGDVLRETA